MRASYAQPRQGPPISAAPLNDPSLATPPAFALKTTNEDPVGQRAARSERQIAIGITIDEMQGFFGPPKHLVDYTFKGRPANHRIYQTDEDGAFGSFTFVDEILVEFAGGGRTPLSQVLDGH